MGWLWEVLVSDWLRVCGWPVFLQPRLPFLLFRHPASSIPGSRGISQKLQKSCEPGDLLCRNLGFWVSKIKALCVAHLKMVKIACFTLCRFYQNFLKCWKKFYTLKYSGQNISSRHRRLEEWGVVEELACLASEVGVSGLENVREVGEASRVFHDGCVPDVGSLDGNRASRGA